MEKAARVQEHERPVEAGKSEQTDAPPELPEVTLPSDTLTLAQEHPLSAP